MTWETVKLGELVRIRTGKLDANKADENGLYPFFTCAIEPLTINTPAFDCKAVLVAGNGDLNVKYYEGKFNAYQRTYVIESLDENRILPRYLYLFLNDYVSELRKLAIGGVIKYIKLSNLTDALIPLPPLDVQQRTIFILDKSDQIKQKRELGLKKLESLMQSIFMEMFGDGSLDRFPISKLSDLCDLKGEYGAGSSAIEYHDSLPRYIRITDINADGSLSDGLVSPSGVEQDWKKYYLKQGDLLFARSGATVGKAYLHKNEANCIFAGYLIRFRPNIKKALPEYIFAFTKTNVYKTWIEKRQNVVAQPNINAKQYGELEIPLPPIELQNKFVELFKKIEVQKKSYLDALTVHNHLLKSIQSQVFSKQL